MSQIIPILNYEEGYVESPYLDTLGFPTVAGGIRIGPKGASLSNYTFTVPREVGDVWKMVIMDKKIAAAGKYPRIQAALEKCNEPRRDVLYSMMYQLGLEGLNNFTNTLKSIAAGDFDGGAS